jgi:alpha-L-rhamnosidase
MTARLWALVPLALASCGAPPPDWEVVALRVDYLDSPLGLDAREPRLSWKLDSTRKNERQSRFRVRLSNGWERDAKTERTFVDYDGPPLVSRERYTFTVESWNRDGSLAAEAESSWEMGLLDPGDWKASWIGLSTGPGSAPSPYLRKDLTLERAVKRARLYATALGVYELHLNGERVGDSYFAPGWTDYRKRLQYQTYDVTELVREGENALIAVLGDGW